MNQPGIVRGVGRVVALAAVLVGAGHAAAEDPILRLRAFAVNMNNRVKTSSIDIAIERWSTPEEADKLKAILVEKDSDALLSALQKIKPRCGYVTTPGKLAWDIYYAKETALPGGGRKIVVATNRPVQFWEARNSGRSMDYQFSLAEIRIGADGKGEGKAIPRAQLTYNKETNTLEIENYEREPVRLNEVTVQEPKK